MVERWHEIILRNRDVAGSAPGVPWVEPADVLLNIRKNLVSNLHGSVALAERLEREFPRIFEEFIRRHPESDADRTRRFLVLLKLSYGALGVWHGQTDTEPSTIREHLMRWGEHDTALVDWAMSLYP